MAEDDQKTEVPEGREGVAHWLSEIQRAEKYFGQWCKDADRIVKRYRNERKGQDTQGRTVADRRFNILWSNVQTTRPVIYGRVPAPEVERRYKDSDPVGRVASIILERSLSYSLDEYDFNDVMRGAVEDLQLAGRGTAWVRYNAETEEKRDRFPVQMVEAYSDDGIPRTVFMDAAGMEFADDDVLSEGAEFYVEGEPYDEKVYEEAVCDFVHYADFLHKPCRTWAEVQRRGWVARRTYMDRKELKERFGDDLGSKVKLTATEAGEKVNSGESTSETNLAVIWEIWNAPDRRVYWVSPGYESGILDSEDDPLGLRNFFPCPRPLYGTTTNNKTIPVPDFLQYEDQATELDDLTSKIDLIVDALRVAGVYAASEEDTLDQLFDGTNRNVMIPVQNWQAIQGKGGLAGIIEWVPIQQIAQTLASLYDAREAVKQTLYEITGIADIIRGQSAASETLGAQKIKGRFATLRLDEKQRDVARFARDLMRIKAEIMAEHYEPETLAAMSGIELTRDAQEPQFAQVFEQAIELLRDDVLRGFRVDIETDSTVVLDEEEEKQSRVEFLQAAGSFMQQAVEVGQVAPQMTPLLGEMLLFGIKGFRAGRQLESAFEDAVAQMKQAAQQPQQQGPDPRQIEAEAKAQQAQADMAISQQRAQADMQTEQAKAENSMSIEAEKARNQMAIDAYKAQIEATQPQG